MKKIVLSVAAVMAAAAFAPEASAVPVFARQTGMACSACHFQHFPLLNGFGRAFKTSGFTMMGAQAQVEGEHLAIPATLNMAVLSSAYYQNEKNTGGAAAPKIGVPGSGGEFSLFVGGKISEFAGFLSEVATNGAGNGGTQLGAAKLVMLFPMGESRVGFSAYTGGQGAAYGYEVMNTGAADTHKMMGNAGPNKQHVAAAYAGSYMGTRVSATGANVIVANNDMGFISVGKYAAVGPGVGANTLPLTYVRAAALFDLAGWDSGVGIQNFSGTHAPLNGALASYKATVLDAQFQGEVAGMGAGIYLTYATAPGDVNGNLMNAGWSPVARAGNVTGAVLAGAQAKSTSFNVAGSLEVIPGIATVQAAYRQAKNGNYVQTGDNAFMLGGTYELAQNIELGLNYTMNSGSAWNAQANPAGKTATTLLLEALF